MVPAGAPVPDDGVDGGHDDGHDDGQDHDGYLDDDRDGYEDDGYEARHVHEDDEADGGEGSDGHGPGGRRGRRVPAPRRRVPLYRRVAFGLAVCVLIAAIPLLGREGYQLVANSRAGKDATSKIGPEDPNYVEAVESTPTAVLAQTDAEGRLVALTVLARSSESGGTVLFLPIAARLREPRYVYADIAAYFEAQKRKLPGLLVMVGEVLDVGIDRVDGFDDGAFARWVEPVGDLTFSNPDEFDLPDGTHLVPGEVTLTPAQVGPYLAHLGEGEDQFAQYARHQLVWQAWLAAIAEAPDPDAAVPGGPDDPLAELLRHLARGTTRIETIPGAYDETRRFVPDEAALTSLMLDAVPVPDSPRPGARHRIRVLNGVAPDPPSAEVVRALVGMDGTITEVGNGPSFDREVTEVRYSEEEDAGLAKMLLAALGATDGEVLLDPSQVDEADFTVILGRDVTEAAAPTTAGDP